MVPWIKIAKEQLLNIFEDVKKDFPQADIRVGFVGYRDVCDRPQEFEFLSLTHNHHAVVDKLSTTEAFGGGDICENVAGAIRKLNAMNWRENACKLAFHVADAPAHGILYHDNGVTDDYPQEIAGMTLFPEICLLASEEVSLTFIRIDSCTDIMTNKFKEFYSSVDCDAKFKVINFEHQGPNPGFILGRMISLDITRSISASLGDPSTP
jgi:hypothetical protein